MSDLHCFLSYAHVDFEIALKLALDLKSEEASVWMDKLSISAGSNWDAEVEKGLEAAKHFLIILSVASVKSSQVMNEVHYALDRNKQIIPIKIDNCQTPLQLIRLQYVDVSNNYEEGLDHLLKELGIERKFRSATGEALTFSTYEKAMYYFDKKYYTKALELFLTEAEVGNSEAENYIGYMYGTGLGVKQDHVKAMEWYSRAAAAGNAEAMNNIRSLYSNGRIAIACNYLKAMEWYKKAAALGNSKAMYNVGLLYKSGQYVYTNSFSSADYDNITARDWFIKAADAGSLDAIQMLISFYSGNWQGIQQDFRKVLEWEIKAADAGSSMNINGITDLYKKLNGITANYQLARQWCKDALEGRNNFSLQNILEHKFRKWKEDGLRAANNIDEHSGD